MNSPKRNAKNSFIVKKAVDELPEIGRLNCKALGMSLYHNKNDKNDKNEKILHIET